jgi:hypothetical protein
MCRSRYAWLYCTGTTRTICDLPMGIESIAVVNIDADIDWHDANWCARSDSNARPLGS